MIISYWKLYNYIQTKLKRNSYLNKNIWNHKTVYKLFVLDRNTWCITAKTLKSKYEVIQWIRWILPNKLEIGKTVYSCILFKEINNGWLVGFYGISTFVGYLMPNPEWTWEWWQWRGTPHSPKLQHYWNLTIRLFSVLSRTLVGGVLPPTEKQSVYSTPPANWARNQ